MTSQIFYESHEKDIISAFSGFNIIELPAGYIGEVNESFELLKNHGIELSGKNILSYIRAKVAIMSFLRNEESELMKSYPPKEIDKRAGGIVIPEWLVASALMIGLFVDLHTVRNILYSKLVKEFPKEKKEKITQVANNIINIKEVKELTIIINEEKDS